MSSLPQTCLLCLYSVVTLCLYSRGRPVCVLPASSLIVSVFFSLSVIQFSPSLCVGSTHLHHSRCVSFWRCSGLLAWLVNPHTVTPHLIFSQISGDEIASLLWAKHPPPLSIHTLTLTHSHTHRPTSSPHPLHPHARPLGLSADVTLSQGLSLKSSLMWQYWPHRLSLSVVTGHAPASHYANSQR